jgi:hypothetical protein
MHQLPRGDHDIKTGYAAPPTITILFGPWLLRPESVLAASWRAGGFGVGKTTLSPRRTGHGPVEPLATARRKIDCSGSVDKGLDCLDREAEIDRLPRAGGKVGRTMATCQTLSLSLQKTWESTNFNSAAVQECLRSVVTC